MSVDKVIAKYRSSGVLSYAGNPFIEALPPLQDSFDVVGQLQSSISIGIHDLQASKIVRAHNICRILDNFFQPFGIHRLLSERISLMIQGGYVGRNPKTGDYQQHLQNGYERVQTGELSSFRFDSVQSTAQSLLLIGCSGSGKTTSLGRILRTYPQVIYHPDLNLEQVVYLKIDCSHNGSLKEICLNFFRAMDRVLGSNYEKRYGLKRHGIETMMALMSQIANTHALGLLVIDEIQHLSRSKAGSSQAMLNFFVTMVNTIGVPVMLIGTPKALDIFDADLRSARRGAGLGAFFWEPLAKKENGIPNDEWVSFTNNLWRLQFLQGRHVELSDEIRDTWYDLSQGVIDIVVKLFVLAQLRALYLKEERISKGLLLQVYQDELKPVHPMLEALRSGKPEKIAMYSDLMIPDLDKRLIDIRTEISSICYKTPEESDLEQLTTDREKRIYMMLKDEYESDVLVRAIQRLGAEHPDLSRQQLLVMVINLLSEPNQSARASSITSKSEIKKRIKIEEWETLADDDLRHIYSKSQSAEDIYSEMKKQGLVFDLKKFFG